MADSDSIKLCECGCGKPPPLAKATQTKYGHVRGQPCRFIRGHAGFARFAHGHAKPRSPTYKSWLSMMERCNNSRAPNYARYGRAGISVSERWSSFDNFLEDMGVRPPGTSLDRHPNQSGNYEPGNCRWATAKQQQRNTSLNLIVEHNGRSLCLAEWAEIFGIQKGALYMRYRSGKRPPELFSPSLRGSSKSRREPPPELDR